MYFEAADAFRNQHSTYNAGPIPLPLRKARILRAFWDTCGFGCLSAGPRFQTYFTFWRFRKATAGW
jgi:hypothetical protein